MRIYDTDMEIEESLVEILSKDERMRLATLAVAGNKEENQEARMRFVLSLTKFIIAIATKKYSLRGADLEEAVAESYLRLWVYFSPPPESKHGTTSRFNPDLGYNPITYAGHIINSAIHRFVTSYKDTIGIPEYLSLRLRGVIQELENCEFMTEAEFDKLLEKNKVSKSLFAQYSRTQNLLSLDAPLSRNKHADLKNSTLIDIIPDEKELGFDEKIFKTLYAQKILQQAFEKLTEREIKVLKLFYGLDNNTPHNYAELAKILGVSEGRVRQICLSGQRKIRNWFKQHSEYAETIKHLLN